MDQYNPVNQKSQNIFYQMKNQNCIKIVHTITLHGSVIPFEEHV